MNNQSKEYSFSDRHLGPNEDETKQMLSILGFKDLTEFINKVLPDQIKLNSNFEISKFKSGLSEVELISYLSELASKNKVFKSYIGCGYYGTNTPAVIQRNILENPGWYTQYTPYQPEISQGRLEALLNFQTMICDLTGMEIANASMLDEASACAEAMTMSYAIRAKDDFNGNKYFVDENIFPQNLAVLQTRAKALGFNIVVEDFKNVVLDENYFGALIQYPAANGEVNNFKEFGRQVKAKNIILTVASDLMALCLLEEPSVFGADIVLGNSQRFGVPMGYGGPHAGFFATKTEFQRLLPGRLVGVSKDRLGNKALRLALQTREQHIRREKATSNICTAQVLLAIMASMYAVYNGPKGLKAIASNIYNKASLLKEVLEKNNFRIQTNNFFDTLEILSDKKQLDEIKKRALEKNVNLGFWKDGSIIVALDETVSFDNLKDLIFILLGKSCEIKTNLDYSVSSNFSRTSSFLNDAVFNQYHSETEFLRYLKRLEAKDLSLTASMIPLGSCTMKLNATSEMLAVTWKEFSCIHPFAPVEQTAGYQELINTLEECLKNITGFSAVSLQPNAGSQGEYAGLLAIKAYHEANGQNRSICLIPKSAHGTNPASAVVTGLEVVAVNCDANGNIDIKDLEEKAIQYKANLSCLMITYPSTHGVFEESIKSICEIIHKNGGQVYLDGANLNALVGLAKPAELGADVMHINLHKTFAIPHGGGGPGVGPIGVASHLAEFIPSHTSFIKNKSYGPVAAAPWGSASILPISLSYIAMLGTEGVKKATEIAILNANYIAKELSKFYPVLYKGNSGFVAHECILDCRGFKEFGIEVDDIAKRLMDYGFHAPTVSWPVPGTIMIEPTESESKKEIDRFIKAMIGIYNEIQKIKTGEYSKDSNPLKNAPHTALDATKDDWTYPYSREVAVYPDINQKLFKFWPAVARIDGAFGDRNLVCTCVGMDNF